MDLISELRESRKSHTVLLQQILAVRSTNLHTSIFVFEGTEDVGVYECWINRCSDKIDYVPVAGNGKEQLINLHTFLESKNPDLLKSVYMFVDRDFDSDSVAAKNIFELEAYSIENILCCTKSIQSILYDEMEQSADALKKTNILRIFNDVLTQFEEASKELNLYLFVLRRQKIKLKRKPEKLNNYCQVTLHNVHKTYDAIGEILEIDGDIYQVEVDKDESEFNKLPRLRSQRGKYQLYFLRKWLELLTSDLKSPSPTVFKVSKPNLKGEPWNFKLRRLASASPLPDNLINFIKAIEKPVLDLE